MNYGIKKYWIKKIEFFVKRFRYFKFKQKEIIASYICFKKKMNFGKDNPVYIINLHKFVSSLNKYLEMLFNFYIDRIEFLLTNKEIKRIKKEYLYIQNVFEILTKLGHLTKD